MTSDIRELKWAAQSVAEMESATDLAQYAKSWSDFLSHFDRFWNKLKDLREPSYATALSELSTQRGNDELLRYFMHARNSNEHTIRPVLVKVDGAPSGGTTVTAGAGGGTIVRGVIEGGKPIMDLIYEGNLTFQFGRDRLELNPVRSRDGTTYPVPASHLGRPLTTQVPHEVAKLGLDFCARLFPSFA